MPKRKATSLLEFEQALMQPGHRWKNRLQMLSVFFETGFKSTRNSIVYAMYMSNWIEISPSKPHKSITLEDIATTLDKFVTDIVDKKSIYNFFGTSPNTFKAKYKRYLNLPEDPTIGQVILAMNKWTDKKWQILHPIKKKDIATLPGMHHKKLSIQINETPRLKEFLIKSKLTYAKIKGFPPAIVEDYFEEIGEPERYQELVELLT